MKISIITATWNRADTIRSTIESILSQEHQDWEHIIIDGASTDNTLEIIEEYRPQYAGRLKLLSEPDKGIYDAMNKGLRMAQGDIVGLLNSDDFYADPQTLTRIAENLTDEIDAIFGDCDIVDFNDINHVTRHYLNKGFRRWKMRLGYMPSHPTFYCRRDIYDRFGDFDISFRIAADFDWLLRTIYVGRIRLRYIPQTQTLMRDGGVSNGGFAAHKRVMAEHQRSFEKLGLWYSPACEFIRFAHKSLRKLLHLPY